MKKTFVFLLVLFAVAFSSSALFGAYAEPNNGQTVTLSVTVDGTAPFTYQWYKNGIPLSGAVGDTYPFGAVNPTHSGTYCVVVSNSAGSTTSDNAILWVTSTLPKEPVDDGYKYVQHLLPNGNKLWLKIPTAVTFKKQKLPA